MNVRAQQAPGVPVSAIPVQKKQQTGLTENWMSDFEACEDWIALSTTPLGDTKSKKNTWKT